MRKPRVTTRMALYLILIVGLAIAFKYRDQKLSDLFPRLSVWLQNEPCAGVGADACIVKKPVPGVVP